MDLQEYQHQLAPLKKQISELTSTMVSEVRLLIEKNIKELQYLIVDDDFTFWSTQDKFLQKTNVTSLELFSYGGTKIYFESSSGSISFFEHDPNTQIGLPTPISNAVLNKIFEDPNLYKEAIHIFGLTGILESDLRMRSETLAALQANK